jgi:hypothetical protein
LLGESGARGQPSNEAINLIEETALLGDNERALQNQG